LSLGLRVDNLKRFAGVQLDLDAVAILPGILNVRELRELLVARDGELELI
jgi:hypothetical protein